MGTKETKPNKISNKITSQRQKTLGTKEIKPNKISNSLEYHQKTLWEPNQIIFLAQLLPDTAKNILGNRTRIRFLAQLLLETAKNFLGNLLGGRQLLFILLVVSVDVDLVRVGHAAAVRHFDVALGNLATNEQDLGA